MTIENKDHFDVIVIGSGHASIEAALAPARMGLRVLMVTLDPSKIGQMSCNPAIGGIAKGQVVKEIDALGGEMGRATDQAAMQFRLLNRSRGPAVWSPRAQCDREKYRQVMTQTVHAQKNLTVRAGECVDIFVDNGRAAGIIDNEGKITHSQAVIVSTGTFLKGLLHCGLDTVPGGRRGEAPANGLSEGLKRLGFTLDRLKTGTPMRLDGRTINYAKLEIQPGDSHPLPFSRHTRRLPQKQIPCWLGYTNEKTHEAIRKDLHLSPIYSGRIDTTGVRYCPSIEDKIVKFPHHDRHHIFVEPEGYFTDEVYINGLFTSLPPETQEALTRTIPGFEDAKFIRYGYAVEYDYAPPTQIHPTLETKILPGLYFAGQINGTTGYEEAAGQGLMAGINAALAIKGEEALVLGRNEAYIGVMVDDLVTKGVDEPYRLLTSRAEYRLHLRWDNAEFRLMEKGHRVGLVPDEDLQEFRKFEARVKETLAARKKTHSPMAGFESFDGEKIDDPLRFFDLEEGPWSDSKAHYQTWVQHKYDGYMDRQASEIEKFQKLETKKIPDAFIYKGLSGLLLEAQEKLTKVKPQSVGQASRIPGITPSDISVLLIHLRKQGGKRESVKI